MGIICFTVQEIERLGLATIQPLYGLETVIKFRIFVCLSFFDCISSSIRNTVKNKTSLIFGLNKSA